MTETKKQEEQGFPVVEWMVFGALMVSLGIVSAFHEPWLNEAQAWQIARNASLKDILLTIPHYEGHPALWHLMLLLPAKLGLPYEFSIKVISNIAVLLIGWLLLFRSPFPRLMRILLPFHYFIFYQNGVISRPYGYMTLALFCMALTFQKRKEHPWRFVLAMAFLCMLSGYGIVLAGGVALVWTAEICVEKKWKLFSLPFWRDGRVHALGGLLLLAIALILQILPASDAYAFTIEKRHSLLYCLVYGLFAMLPDCTLFNLLGCEEMPAYAAMDSGQLAIAVAVGILFWIAILLYSSPSNRWYFIVPYVLFQVFSGIVYLTAHHIGIALSFALFWLWIAWEDPQKAELFKKVSGKVALKEGDAALLQGIGRIAGLLLLCIPVFWTLGASYLELRYDYYFSKDAAVFIKEHHLDQALFLAQWGSEEEPVNVNSLNANNNPVAVMPYFDHNFCMNLNGGREDMAYTLHKVASEEESREAFRQLKEKGLPEAMIGSMDLSLIYGEGASMNDYVPVYEMNPKYVSIWKFLHVNTVQIQKQYIYVRKDLLERFGVEELSNGR